MTFSRPRFRVFSVSLGFQCPTFRSIVLPSLFLTFLNWRWNHTVIRNVAKFLPNGTTSLSTRLESSLDVKTGVSLEQPAHHLTIFVNVFRHFSTWQVFSLLRFVTSTTRCGVSATVTQVVRHLLEHWPTAKKCLITKQRTRDLTFSQRRW